MDLTLFLKINELRTKFNNYIQGHKTELLTLMICETDSYKLPNLWIALKQSI